MPRFLCADWSDGRLFVRPSNDWGRDHGRFVHRSELLDFLPCDGQPSELIFVRRIRFTGVLVVIIALLLPNVDEGTKEARQRLGVKNAEGSGPQGATKLE